MRPKQLTVHELIEQLQNVENTFGPDVRVSIMDLFGNIEPLSDGMIRVDMFEHLVVIKGG